MPIHDWTRVTPGIFHATHNRWLGALQDHFNAGLLPEDYYALADQNTGNIYPDVVALQVNDDDFEDDEYSNTSNSSGGLALAEVQPKTSIAVQRELEGYPLRQRHITIRHSSGDRIVAIVEIVSLGNKSSRREVDRFVQKAHDTLERGQHLLIVDLHPPTTLVPDGFYPLIWEEPFTHDDQLPLQQLSFVAGNPQRAFMEPTAVGRALFDMPLFLTPEMYINVPLELTYLESYRGVPQRWKRVIEGTSNLNGTRN
jgi:Protein of unknown function (DUF4058)